MKLLKLSDFTAEGIAREVAEEALRAAARMQAALGATGGVVRPDLEGTPIYAAAFAVARYAMAGVGRGLYVPARNRLIKWLGEAEVMQAEPGAPLALAVAAAEAREALHAHAPLTSMQVAILAGLDRDYVNALALRDQMHDAYRSDENRHRPWRFKPTVRLCKWVQERPGAVQGLC